MLNIKDIVAGYGDVTVLNHVSLNVPKGEVVAMIGANAAGKSTLLKVISGTLRLSHGEVIFMEKRLNTMTAIEIVELGLIQVPEGRKLFSYMTVEENLEMGAYNKRARGRVSENKEKVFSLFPILEDRRKQLAGSLSGGEQQMCAVARGLMAEPELLILDEPSLGLAPIMVTQLFGIISNINKMGTTILLVEQNANLSLKLANHACVLENGRIAIEGNSKDLLDNVHVKKAYLGL